MEQLGPPLERFSFSLIFECFSQICRENSISIRTRQEWRAPIYNFDHISLNFSYTGKGFRKILPRKSKQILCPIFYNRGVHEIMWKNIVERNRSQVTISRMRITCWIPKATNSHSVCVILVTFTLQRWFLERACLLPSSVHCLSCRIFIKPSGSGHFEPGSFYLNGVNCENRPSEQTLRGKI